MEEKKECQADTHKDQNMVEKAHQSKKLLIEEDQKTNLHPCFKQL